jgi:hypothetical protein
MIDIIVLEGLTSQKNLDDHHLIVLEGLTSQKSLDDHHLKVKMIERIITSRSTSTNLGDSLLRKV